MVSMNQFYNFSLLVDLEVNIYKEPRNNIFKKLNKSVLFHIKFYVEVDDHKPVDFNGETISFTCQIFKK